jgi:hypothetical protein
VLASTAQITRYFRFKPELMEKRKVHPDGEWMAEATVPKKNRVELSYLQPLDPDDDWASVGKNTLAAEWIEVPENEVPIKVRMKAEDRLSEHPSFLPTR